MGWEVTNLTLRGGLESILEGVSDIRNYDSEVVSGSDSDNYIECSF